jgi:hypothetical protein
MTDYDRGCIVGSLTTGAMILACALLASSARAEEVTFPQCRADCRETYDGVNIRWQNYMRESPIISDEDRELQQQELERAELLTKRCYDVCAVRELTRKEVAP